jgi:chromosomal replication initiator protein
VSGSQFVDELIAALQDGTVDKWRARYRSAGALIVDDVHALAGKERSQDELFHLFNALHSAGKQVVLASDRPPSEIGELEARLRSRFDGGLVVAIQPPDKTLREALYSRMLLDRAPGAEPGVAALLAELPVSGAAEVESVVDRIVHLARAAGSRCRSLGASSTPAARRRRRPSRRSPTSRSSMPRRSWPTGSSSTGASSRSSASGDQG